MTTAFAKPQTTMFIAARYGLRLVKEPKITIRNPANGMPMETTAGETIEFRQGRYDAADDTILQWLRRHPLYGDHHDGFWEMEQVVPEPSQEELDAILQAATDFDVPALEGIVRAERDGWAREKVLHIAEGALERVKAALIEAQQAQDEEK